MTPRLPRILGLVLVVLAAFGNAARALTVFDYNSSLDQRFNPGSFPTAPVANSSFFLAEVDLSGIGWETNESYGVTLISSQYLLTAAHVAPSHGATINFLNTDGVLKQYVVDGSYVLPHPGTENTDLALVRLTQPIAPDDHVTAYPTLLLNSLSAYNGLDVVAFGGGQRAGFNEIDITGVADFLPFGSGNDVADDYAFITDFDSVSGQTQGQGGDSGSPTFVVIDGSLALIGTHSGINVGVTPNITIDVLVAGYYGQINQRLANDDQSWSAYVIAIPEPATGAAFAGLAVLGCGGFVRRRRRAASNRA